MVPGSRCMSGNTCSHWKSWTYSWAVMVPRINTRGGRSSFLVRGTTPNGGVDGWASRAAHVTGAAIPNVLQPGAFVWFREDTGAPSEDATCAWMSADEAVGCTRVFLMMWRSSRRLVCRGRTEPCLRVNDIFRIHWSPTPPHNIIRAA
ncbi:uncharacterized protein TNCV_2276241 [Trichonephila clavipes]|nr:uncharacterized protein TNCV_2276241 [Trichonephila clavipes]